MTKYHISMDYTINALHVGYYMDASSKIHYTWLEWAYSVPVNVHKGMGSVTLDAVRIDWRIF